MSFVITTQEFQKKIKRVLITEQEIQDKIQKVGAQISREYEGKPLLLVSILNGALVFMADQCRAIPFPVKRLSCVPRAITTAHLLPASSRSPCI